MPAVPSVAVAFAARSPGNVPIACVIVKRTYEIDPTGKVRLAAEQGPLALPAEANPSALFPEPSSDTDLYPVKLFTDVVVKGRVHAQGNVPVRRRTVSVKVGAHEKVIEVIGDRTVQRIGAAIVFSEPEPFTTMDLTFTRAYGGIDRTVPLPPIRELEDLLALLGRELTGRHPGKYPRNPGGTGYCVTGAPEALEGLRLPNFEDPRRLLTPATLVVGKPEDWWKMPLPQGLGWFASGNYPRCLFFGTVPEYAPPDDSDVVEEVKMGLVPRGQSARTAGLAPHELMDFRLTNGAAPGLVLPELAGDEHVRLRGLSPDGDLDFPLPGNRPRVEIAFKARPLDVTVKLHTVLIEPDERRLSLVWGARAPLPAGWPERLPSAGGAPWDELEGFEIRLDGAPVPHEPVNPFGLAEPLPVAGYSHAW